MRISDWSSGVCSSDLVANGEIVADRPTEAGEAEANGIERLAPFTLEVDGQPIVLDPQQDLERSLVTAGREMILLEQIEDRDSSLLLDIGVATDDRSVVELDIDDARFAHVPRSEEHTSELQSLMRISYAV